ncbi:hypothetical protein [Marinomonas posidonica]|uniref:hypothetical protein n=1 Tax=Marinomonas posidonica TaxID=936476 RepID=UPI003736C9C2
MKYDYTLKINGEASSLITHDIVLDSSIPGRATFKINATDSPSGIVLFSFKVNNGKQHNHFYGYIERAAKISNGVWSIFCREKANALEQRVPLSLRNKTLKDILDEVKKLTGVGFTIPQADYTTKAIPYCFNTGNGFHLLQSLGNMLEIKDYLWQQRRDGLIYVGSWSDGHWPKQPINIANSLFDKQSPTQSAEIMAIPGLRPNFMLNGTRLKSIRMIDAKMVVSWKR